MIRHAAFALLALLCLTVSSEAQSVSRDMRDLPPVAEVNGPRGWQVWCRAHSDSCVAARAATLALTPANWQTLNGVWADLAGRFVRVNDTGRQDVWRAAWRGDCEDFALNLRERLIKAGVPRGALDLVVGFTEHGEAHTVLAIHSAHGTLIADVRQDRLLPWHALPYTWLAMEQAGSAQWRRF